MAYLPPVAELGIPEYLSTILRVLYTASCVWMAPYNTGRGPVLFSTAGVAM